jgi:hypothetical protein
MKSSVLSASLHMGRAACQDGLTARVPLSGLCPMCWPLHLGRAMLCCAVLCRWGHDFRPAYLELATLKQDFPNTPIAAMTVGGRAKLQNLKSHLLQPASCTARHLMYCCCAPPLLWAGGTRPSRP